MARGDLIVARLIVWEGAVPADKFRSQIQALTKALKESIDYTLRNTPWRYQIWKTRPSADEGKHRLEIHIKHPMVADKEKYAAIDTLCQMLLISDLPSNLRGLHPGMSFAFCPSTEGIVDSNDEVFAQYFCKTIVEYLCIGDGKLSKKMEAMRDSFMDRNSTKFFHQPMVGMYNLATQSERYANQIQDLLLGIDTFNNGTKLRGDMQKAVVAVVVAGNKGLKTQQEKASAMAQGIAVACELIRGFVAVAPELKDALRPQIQRLNEVVIAARLVLAKNAYIANSNKPIEALEKLRRMDNPTNEDLATTVNAFGILMQSTLPLFDQLYTISDAEFSTVASLSLAAGGGVLASAGGVWWAMAASSVGGPVAMIAAGAAVAVGCGVGAIVKGIEWGNKQKLNPSIVLLEIQKSLQECSLFILGLIYMAAQRDKNPVYQAMLQHLEEQLKNANYAKKGYQKGYYKNVSEKLANDMKDLKKGLAKYNVTASTI
ncbi:hypothetical protein CC86DRAFT_469099 [Ophiobolus disseminans]|uniref:Uncharacterized protein n=1 Tax=Ophiobolus disseminans TaxID=1469910 RepID=A0A6A6ZQ76_9PLEO|nr:hypothetical protein CC86DRAFT_469099 [Ophiobolus disseminans]